MYAYVPGMTVWSSPAIGVVADRAVLFVGSYDHSLYALDAASGELLWKVTTGDGVYATPILWRRPEPGSAPQLFVSSSDRLLYALDAETGARAWIHSVADYRPTLGGARLGSVCVGSVRGEAAVFLPYWVWDRSLASSQQEGGVTALAASDGRVLWRRTLGDNELTAATCYGAGPYVPAAASDRGAGDRVYVGAADGNLFALAADDGQTLWRRTEVDAIRGAPVVANAGVGARLVMTSKSGLVRGLDPETGAELWRYHAGDWVTGGAAVATIQGRPLVFVGSYDRTLYALDLLTGTLAWRAHADAAIHAAPAVAADTTPPLALFTAWDHHLYGVNAKDGERRFRIYTGRPIWDAVGLEASNWSAPIVASVNGAWMAYSGSYDGTFYGFSVNELLRTGDSPRRASLGFWVSFPVALAAVGLVARWLTVRARRRRGAT